MPLQAAKSKQHFTYKDYIQWPEKERWELIKGNAYNMTPAPSKRHQDISYRLEKIIGDFLWDKSCQMYHAPFDVRFPETDERDENIQSVVQPDIIIVCDQNKLDDKGCRGAPDIIIEIISPATASRDMKEKYFLYENHRVLEYWIVYPEEQVISVNKLNKHNEFDRAIIYSSEDKLQTPLLKGLVIEVDKIF